MKVLALEIYRCDRWSLSDITKLTVNMTDPLQLVLGTNGSGKSVYFSLTLPTAPDATMFGEDGYRYGKWEHQGHTFEIRNTYPAKGSPEHSFKMNGEELNEGHTGKVQQDLVYRHLGIDKDLGDLLTDQLTLTSMTAAQRKDWFRRIAPSDIDLLFTLFKSVEKEARDRKGFVANTDKILAEEHDNLKQLEAENRDVGDRITSIRRDLDALMQLTEGLNLTPAGGYNPEDRMRQLLADIDEVNQMVLRKDYPALEAVSDEYQMDAKYIRDMLESLKHERSGIEAQYHAYGEELSRINQKLEKADLDLLNATERQWETILTALADVDLKLRSCTEIAVGDVHESFSYALEEVIKDLSPLLDNLPEDNEHLTKEQLGKIESKLSEVQDQKLQMEQQLLEANQMLEHFDHAHSADCPKCSHTFKPGFDLQDVERYRQQTKVLADNIEAAAKGIKHLEEQHLIQTTYRDTVMQISGMLQHPDFKYLHNHIMGSGRYRTDPRSLRNDLADYYTKVELLVQRKTILDERDKVEPLLNGLRDAHDTDLAAAKGTKTQLESKMESALKDMQSLSLEIKAVSEHLTAIDYYQSLQSNLTDLRSELEDVMRYILHSSFDSEVKSTRDHLQDRLVKANNIADTIQTKRVLIQEYEKNSAKARKEQADLKSLSDALSPNGGLISDLLAGSIGAIMHQMNLIINSVWTYDFHLLDKSDHDVKEWLKYRFPFTVANKKSPTPDVSRGSSAQKDIINFAFKLVVYSYLGLKDYPLYLDELGKTFDEEHRGRVMTYIRTCLESQSFSQVFMISHYITQYSHLIGNSEALVISTDNISPPAVYNEHVTIE